MAGNLFSKLEVLLIKIKVFCSNYSNPTVCMDSYEKICSFYRKCVKGKNGIMCYNSGKPEYFKRSTKKGEMIELLCPKTVQNWKNHLNILNIKMVEEDKIVYYEKI